MAKAPPSIASLLHQTNQRLKAAALGLTLEQRDQKLSLRGTLPPRPGSRQIHPHQQRISLNLPATPSGLKLAERQVKIIAAQLLQDTFDWSHYSNYQDEHRLEQMELPGQLLAFEQDFFNQPRRLKNFASARTTWDTAYAPYLKKLAQVVRGRSQLTLAQAIDLTLQSTAEDSRSRQACCTALRCFAEFMGATPPETLTTLRGDYGTGHTQLRDLPSDELIVQIFEQIPNPQWQFVYGIMATYGLRNHEVFFCDYSTLNQPEATVQVLSTTKTGSHEVWPFYPEWVGQFALDQGRLPEVNRDLGQTTLRRIGQLVTNQFLRYQIPFSPYDLRHAWAVRTIHFGLSDTVAAKMMGHSVAVHQRTYHQWMTRRDQQQAVQTALLRSSLIAPKLLIQDPD